MFHVDMDPLSEIILVSIVYTCTIIVYTYVYIDDKLSIPIIYIVDTFHICMIYGKLIKMNENES
jgi:hypothetical protein